MNKLFIQNFLCIFFILSSCTENANVKKNVAYELDNIIHVPEFNADSCYSYIKKQVEFGPRYLSSEGAKNCSKWLIKKLSKIADTLIVQEANVITYDKKRHKIKNIIASFHPQKNNRILLMAHWDTRHIADHDSVRKNKPILGANDGGSGVGMLIEIARNIKIKKPKVGIDIILFDGEDYGQPENSKFPIMQDSWCLGSQYWSKNKHRKNYFAKYGILLDMVGGPNAKFYEEDFSKFYADNILQKVWNIGHDIGYGEFFVFERGAQFLDDHYYVNNITSIPTIDIIEFDPSSKNKFNKHWHTHGDDLNNISKKTLKAIGQTVMHVIYND